MLKSLKVRLKNYKLKQALIKNKALFDIDSFNFSNKTILIVDEIIPEYNKDSGSRRLTEIIKLLLKTNNSIFLLADYKQYKYKSKYIRFFKDLGVQVYELSIDENKTLVTKELFIQKISSQIDIAWLHRPLIFQKYYGLITKNNPKIRLVYDMVDFHYLRFQREFELNNDRKLKQEADKFLKIELNNCEAANTVIAISNEDKRFLKAHYTYDEKIKVLSNIHQHIPKQSSFNPFSKRNDLLFVGSFRHDPNRDAVVFLKNEIMPLIWKQNPEIKVNVVGSYVTSDIEALASPNFIIKGFVNDLNTLLEQSKIFVAPLRFGAGIKGKIGQSLENNLPLVTTTIGAEGFNFGTQNKIMVANAKNDIANCIINLYNDELLWNKASNYCETILKPFSLKETENVLLEIIND